MRLCRNHTGLSQKTRFNPEEYEVAKSASFTIQRTSLFTSQASRMHSLVAASFLLSTEAFQLLLMVMLFQVCLRLQHNQKEGLVGHQHMWWPNSGASHTLHRPSPILWRRDCSRVNQRSCSRPWLYTFRHASGPRCRAQGGSILFNQQYQISRDEVRQRSSMSDIIGPVYNYHLKIIPQLLIAS